jgi:glyoxylase-like metal-dependent hydrolase (beta-lactamase superfamily II)
MTTTPTTRSITLDTILALDTPDLGNRSYIVTDGEKAAVVDPPRDIDRVIRLCQDHGLSVTWVLETHLHNDYVSGGLQLAREAGARYGISAAETVAFPRFALPEGARLAIGEIEMRVVATPGHTHGHVAYVVHAQGRPQALLSGGSLLYGGVGRTDLCGDEHTAPLARLQFQTARGLAASLPASIQLHPTHGFGSGCSVGAAQGRSGSLADELSRNPVYSSTEEEFTQRMAGLYPPPRSYARIGPINRVGLPPIDLSPLPLLSDGELAELGAQGVWLLDVRDRWLHSRGHIPGAVSLPWQRGWAEWVGRVLPDGVDVALVADDAAQLADAQWGLARLVLSRPVGAGIALDSGGDGSIPLAPQPVASFADVAAAMASDEAPVIIDVRRPEETAVGAIKGAHCIPLDVLVADPSLEPPGRLWIHCAAGLRAGIVGSVLAREGRDTVVVDDSWEHAVAAGLPIVSGSVPVHTW